MKLTYLVSAANLADVEPPVKRSPGQHHGDLRNALQDAALELVADSGARGFTMAEAARRAGVSVAAPYKHFADRDALLASLAERAYAEQERRFTAALAGSERPADQLVAAAVAYLDFAVASRPLFDVMFGAGLDKRSYPELSTATQRVIGVLLPPARALRDDDAAAEELVVTLAALAHGHAVYLLEGAFGPPDEALPTIRRRVAGAVALLLTAGGR